MPRKITLKKTQRNSLQSVEELDHIDILNSIESNQNVIQQLEQCLPDYRDILLKNFLSFYMKLCGLEEFVCDLESVTSMDSFRFGQLLQKVEEVQIKNDKTQLVSEEAAKKLTNKTKEYEEFNQNIITFFNQLFSTDCNLPYDCERFFEINLSWLGDMMRCRVRIVRFTCLQLIQIILNQLFRQIVSEQKENKNFIQFVDAIRFHILPYTLKDVYTPIQKKTISICFQYLILLPQHFANSTDSLGHMFVLDKPECREEAIKCFNSLIRECIEKYKQNIAMQNDLLQKICIEFFTQHQDRIISSIFDHNNEETQVETIKIIKNLTQLKHFNKNCFKVSNLENLIKILYRSNDRVKYELLLLMKEIHEEFDTCLNSQGSSMIEQLIEICLKYKPNNISVEQAAQKFISPFLIVHKAVSIPDHYIALILKSDEHHIENFLQTLIYFYGECVRLSHFYQRSSNLYCWIVFDDEKLEQLCSLFETFSHAFFHNLKSLELQFQSNNHNLIAYLIILGYLNLIELSQVQNYELYEHILKSIQRIYEKSQDAQVLKQCSSLLKQLNMPNLPSQHSQLMQDVATQMKNALIHFIELEGTTQFIQSKIMYLVQYNHILLTELLSAQQIQDLRVKSQEVEQQENLLELFAYSVISAFKTFLKVDVKTLKYPNKHLQEYFDEFERTRNIFIEDSFIFLEKTQSLRTYQDLITVLGYINNNKVSFTKAFSFQLNEQQQSILYKTFYNNVLQKLDVQEKIPDVEGKIHDENETLNTSSSKQIDAKLIDLSEVELKSLILTLDLFKTSLKCLDMHFGLPILHFLLVRSFEAKNTRGYISNLLHDLFNQWFGLEFLDQNKETLVYWKVILDVLRFVALRKLDKAFYPEFWRMVSDNYLVRNQFVKRVNLSMKKEKFIMFCAELIFHGFSKIEEIEVIGFMTPMLIKSVTNKIIGKLDIERSMIKKICAFFEAKRQEFEKTHNLEKQIKEHFLQIVNPVSLGLRQISGMSQEDLKRVISSAQKENVPPDEIGEQNAQEIEDELEASITNQEILREQIDHEEEEITPEININIKSKSLSKTKLSVKIESASIEKIIEESSTYIKKKFKRDRK